MMIREEVKRLSEDLQRVIDAHIDKPIDDYRPSHTDIIGVLEAKKFEYIMRHLVGAKNPERG